MNTLVIPTARPQLLLEFLRCWRPWPWDAVIVIEDAPELTLDLAAAEALADGRPIEAYSWTEIERDLSAPWIISKRDSAIRGFGFWKAWQRGARVIVTLDDDCYPAGDGFLDAHLRQSRPNPGLAEHGSRAASQRAPLSEHRNASGRGQHRPLGHQP